VEPLPEIRHFVQFCRTSKRGLIGMEGIRASTSAGEEDFLDEVETLPEEDLFLGMRMR
jgi:UDP-N-acetylglucosamine acyltransferase